LNKGLKCYFCVGVALRHYLFGNKTDKHINKKSVINNAYSLWQENAKE